MAGHPQNRLAREKSPYLLQHARNPVDWYPWGDEAFDKARREDKPVFLSIGYATCHWCHVMERESFEDEEVARLMNDAFVSIKVDREERPDVDSVYMRVCQLMTGSGGWPLTILLTPDRRPFFAATYIPKRERFGRVGMVELIPQVRKAWGERRADLTRSAGQILEHLQRPAADPARAPLRADALDGGFQQLSSVFDERHGGFGSAPKFPTPHQLSFLFRYGVRTGDEWPTTMAVRTLEAMRAGGIWDHVGFGFHRYATDAHWLVPHFEKMLYDQALLLIAYTEAFQITKRPDLAQTAREIASYVLRDLRLEQGGFASAEDADSEGVEGKFYVWRLDELRALLGPQDASFVSELCGARAEGNYREESTGRREGANILHLAQPWTDLSNRLGRPKDQLRARWEDCRRRLMEARRRRVRPLRDDKVLTDWNGLMVGALARAARALDDDGMLQGARDCAEFLLTHLRDSRGRLLHRWREGEAAVGAYLDDYAFLAFGLTELYQASLDVRYLETAVGLMEQAIAHFRDERGGAFFFTGDEAEKLLVRETEFYDGAVPSGNSIMMLNLLRLGRMVARPEWEDLAARLGRAASGSVARSAASHAQLLIALDFALGPAREVVLAGESQSEEMGAMRRIVGSRFLPNAVLLHRPLERAEPVERLAPFLKNLRPRNGKATAYVCHNYQCQLPTSDPKEFERQLEAQKDGQPPQRL